MGAWLNEEQIGCAKEGKSVPLAKAIESFDDKCSPTDCPNYHMCSSCKEKAESG
jgi:hypothetical protein